MVDVNTPPSKRTPVRPDLSKVFEEIREKQEHVVPQEGLEGLGDALRKGREELRTHPESTHTGADVPQGRLEGLGAALQKGRVDLKKTAESIHTGGVVPRPQGLEGLRDALKQGRQDLKPATQESPIASSPIASSPIASSQYDTTASNFAKILKDQGAKLTPLAITPRVASPSIERVENCSMRAGKTVSKWRDEKVDVLININQMQEHIKIHPMTLWSKRMRK